MHIRLTHVVCVSVTARRGTDSGSSERCASIDVGLLTLPRIDPLGQSTESFFFVQGLFEKFPRPERDAKR
jgi:hypothetical protein